MENKNLNIAKMSSTFGIVGLFAGIGLVLIGEVIIGLSCSAAATGITLLGFKTIKDVENGENN